MSRETRLLITSAPTGSEPSIQLLLSQAGSGSLATTMTPRMDLVIALRTVFKAVELTSPAPFKAVPLIAATIAFFNVSIFAEFSECFVFMFVFFRFDVWFCGCISLRDHAFRGKRADQTATILTQFSVPRALAALCWAVGS